MRQCQIVATVMTFAKVPIRLLLQNGHPGGFAALSTDLVSSMWRSQDGAGLMPEFQGVWPMLADY